MAASGVTVAVVVTDSHGRPFRVGNTGVALGVAVFGRSESSKGDPTCSGAR